MKELKHVKDVLKGLGWGILICLLLTLCSACQTKYIAVPEVHEVYINKTDTVIRTDTTKVVEEKTTERTIVVTEPDSTLLAQYGVTMQKNKSYMIQIKDLQQQLQKEMSKQKEEKTSSNQEKKADSIPVPYPVEKELTKIQKARMTLGDAFIIFLILAILVKITQKALKK